MPNLSIKNVPDEVVASLRARAAANHRSLQGELLALVSAVASEGTPLTDPATAGDAESGWKSVAQILSDRKAQRIEVVTTGPRAVDIVRRERDAR